MKRFTDWVKDKQLNEGRPANWSPSPRLDKDPLKSAVAKILKSKIPDTKEHAGLQVLSDDLGLDEQEYLAAKNAKLFVQGSSPSYWKLNTTRAKMLDGQWVSLKDEEGKEWDVGYGNPGDHEELKRLKIEREKIKKEISLHKGYDGSISPFNVGLVKNLINKLKVINYKIAALES
jgi:hypothetical protein